MPWQDFEIVGFVPDLPQNIPGAIFAPTNGTHSFGMYPTAKGFRNGPTPEEVTATAIDSVPLGSAIVYKTDGTARIFVGTAAKLWELTSGTTLTDRSNATYTATPTLSWSFCQFGDITLAACRTFVLQQIQAGGTFSSVGASPVPKASIIVTCGPVSAPFVMAFDFDDSAGHNYNDGWFNSAISDPASGASTSWTTGTSQCAMGRLLDDLPGPIVCAIPFRDGVIAWKPQGMYVGSYGTIITTGWSWERRAHDVGALGKNCAVSVEDMVYWADENGIWMFDGSYPRRVPGHVHNWWREQVAELDGTASTRHLARVVWDAKRRNIWFLLPDSNSSAQTTGLVYHVDSQLWFPVYTIENTAGTVTVFEFVGVLNAINGALGVYVGINRKMGSVTYDDSSGGPALAAMTFGVIGDNIHQFTMTGLRPVILRTALGATTISAASVGSGAFWRDAMTSMTYNATFTPNGEKLHLDGTVSERFLQPALSFTADNAMEIAAKGGKINLQPAGTGGA